MNGASADFLQATDAITIITGIFLLVTGVLCMIYARRSVENLPVNHVMQTTLIFAVLGVLFCPVMFALNLIGTSDAMDSPYLPPGFSSDDSSGGQSTTDVVPPTNITVDVIPFTQTVK